MPLTLNRFVWYGPNNLGSVDLHRRRLALTVEAKPKPDKIELESAQGTFTRRDGSFRDLPAAGYKATLSYGTLNDVHELQITGRAESTIGMIGRVGAVELSSEPPDGSFELKNSQSLQSWTGEFPQRMALLPAGEYRLSGRRGDYQKGVQLIVRPNETNRTVVKFIYGAAEILSEPSESTVFVDNVDRGQTPLNLTNVVPGKYQIRLVKDNRVPEVFELNVSEGGISKVSRKLKNARYVRSMEAARTAVRAKDNILAYANLEAALTEEPNDSDALDLVAKVQPVALRDRALALAEKGQFTEIAALIEELEKINPKAETTEALKSQIAQIKSRKEQEAADRLARLTKERAETEIRKREQELYSAFESLQVDMTAVRALPFATWKSSKSVEQIRTAIDAMSRTGKEMKGLEFNRINDHLFTARFRAGVPVFGTVYSTRVAVCELERGQTEIRAKAASISLADLVNTTEAESVRSRNQLEKFKNALSIQLGGDLK